MAISRKTKQAVAPYLMIAPAAALLVVFVYGVVNGVLQGFGFMPFLGRYDLTLDYYIAALTRSDLAPSIVYSLYLSAVSSVVAAVGGIVLSACLTRLRASRGLHLFSIQVPLMTMHALVALAVVSLFAGSGLVARLLGAGGLLGDDSFPSVVGAASGWGIILVYVWKEIPFVAFCTVTVMAHISSSFGEAANSLGASPLRAFFSVTLPLCRSTVLKAFLVVFAFAFGSYEVPFLLEPTLPKALPVLAYIEFQDPDILNRCYAMALNGVMAMICTVLAIVYFAVLHRERKDDR